MATFQLYWRRKTTGARTCIISGTSGHQLYISSYGHQLYISSYGHQLYISISIPDTKAPFIKEIYTVYIILLYITRAYSFQIGPKKYISNGQRKKIKKEK